MSTDATHTQDSTAPDHHDDPLGDMPRRDDCDLCGGDGYYEHGDETVTCWACIDYDELNRLHDERLSGVTA